MTDQPAPADPRQLRAADTDRDQTAEALRRAAAEGRITFEELDERIGRAYAAKTFADLQALTSDLPGPGVRAPAPATPRYLPPDVPVGTPAPSFSVAVMSGAKRAGPWVVPPSYTAVAIMGGVELDLRYARLAAAEVTIQAFCLMGGVSITVPEDMDVDVSGIGFMGGFDHHASGPGAPGAPRLRVVGFAMMGGVEVKRRPADPARRAVPGGSARPELPGA
jgi:Domain of unknown function (DUF1707)/Cell wall-active antibiotics response 4TMS YvqF